MSLFSFSQRYTYVKKLHEIGRTFFWHLCHNEYLIMFFCQHALPFLLSGLCVASFVVLPFAVILVI